MPKFVSDVNHRAQDSFIRILLAVSIVLISTATLVGNETALARSWPAEGPPILWAVQVGPGFGGPAIDNGQVFILDRVDDEQDVLRCFDFKSGEERWRWFNQVLGRLSNNGSRSVPTVDAHRAYAVGPFGHVYCVDRTTQRSLWQIDLLGQYPREPHQFGYAQSPLLYDDTVIIAPLTDTVGLVAVDQKTGRVRWRSDPIGTKSYTSPTLRTIGGLDCVIFITDQQICGIDAATGRIRWKFTNYNPPQQAATPTYIGADQIFTTAFDGAGSVMIKVTRSDDSFEIEERFRLEYGAQLPPTLFFENYLYGKYFVYDDRRRLASRLICHDLDGNIQWNHGEEARLERGDFIIADGLLIILDAQSGELILAQACPTEYVELTRAKVLDLQMPYPLSPMALANGHLILRDQQEMKCIDLRARADNP